MFISRPEGVAGDDGPTDMIQMDVNHDVAENVAGYGDVPLAAFICLRNHSFAETPDANVSRTAGFMIVLDGAAADRHLGVGTAFDQNIRRGRAILPLIALEVATADLQIANLSAATDDAPFITVADMRG